MRTLKTEPNGELSRDARGRLIVVQGAEAERVKAEGALRIGLGECKYDRSLGLDREIVGASDAPIPVSLEVERAVMRAGHGAAIARVIACETELVETAERAEELGVLDRWRENPQRITWTDVLLQGAHGGAIQIGLKL